MRLIRLKVFPAHKNEPIRGFLPLARLPHNVGTRPQRSSIVDILVHHITGLNVYLYLFELNDLTVKVGNV